VPAIKSAELLAQPDGEPSAAVAQRVNAARERALARQGLANAELEASTLNEHAVLGTAASRFLQSAADRLGWSGRSLHRTLKVARTIADLADARDIEVPHLAEALQYRRGLPNA